MSFVGIRSAAKAILVPMATGMTLTLCLLTLAKQRPNAKYVLWSRIDQKSCFKSMILSNLIPIIIDTIPTANGLITNIPGRIFSLENKHNLALEFCRI